MTDYTKFDTIAILARLAAEAPELSGGIEAVIRQAIGVSEASKSIVPTLEDMQVFRINGKIAAIKQHRARTGIGLKESKDAIEDAAITVFVATPTIPSN